MSKCVNMELLWNFKLSVIVSSAQGACFCLSWLDSLAYQHRKLAKDGKGKVDFMQFGSTGEKQLDCFYSGPTEVVPICGDKSQVMCT